MCLIQAQLKVGVFPAAPLKILIYVKVTHSRSIILRAQTDQNKVWKRCQLRPGLYPQRRSWTHSSDSLERPPQPSWCPCCGAWRSFPRCPTAAAPRMLPRNGAVLTALILARVVGWVLDFWRVPMAPSPQGSPQTLFNLASLLFGSFFLPLKKMVVEQL